MVRRRTNKQKIFSVEIGESSRKTEISQLQLTRNRILTQTNEPTVVLQTDKRTIKQTNEQKKRILKQRDKYKNERKYKETNNRTNI